MKRVVCDMDGVLADLLPTWLRLYGERAGQFIHPEAITAYGFEKFIDEPEAFFDCLAGALKACTPMRGTSTLQELSEATDFTLVSYVHAVAQPEGYTTKLHWLRNWFPEFDRSKFCTMNGQRANMHADYMIDDNPAHITAWLSQNPEGRAFLVQHSYNFALNLDERCVIVPNFDAAAWEILADIEEEAIIT
jgi:5'(3')-deoxyribonucleotidase